MKHPVTLMLQVWAITAISFFALPFILVNRVLTLHGFAMLVLFIAFFCLGGLTLKLQKQFGGSDRTPPSSAAQPVVADFRLADRILMIGIAASVGMLAVLFFQNDFLDLGQAWQQRSDRAVDVMTGSASEAGLLFQVTFLLYPASHVFLVREIMFRARPSLVRLGIFGFLPVVMMSLVMAGRAPLLYTLLLVPIAYLARGRIFPRAKSLFTLTPKSAFLALIFILILLIASNYFVQVFVARFEGIGSLDSLFTYTETVWGVGFEGPFADFLRSTLGAGNTYLLFMFLWYFVQGVPMSNILFSDYVGPPHYGVYGIELVTAIMRRLNGDFVYDRFAALLDLNTYGFFPSAFGSLFVDFGLAGLLICFVWGYLAAIVYERTLQRPDARWSLVVPFVIIGILFSPINTPLGFANGTVTHAWLIIAFLAIRRVTPHDRGSGTRVKAT